MLATADLPIWVTELDIEIEDRTQRADAYDDVVTLYYSYPGKLIIFYFVGDIALSSNHPLKHPYHSSMAPSKTDP